MEQIKSILLSKTFWVAVIQGLLGVVVVLETQIPGVGWLMIIKSVLDFGLRVATTQEVKIL
jgi:hypothetical protein